MQYQESFLDIMQAEYPAHLCIPCGDTYGDEDATDVQHGLCFGCRRAYAQGHMRERVDQLDKQHEEG